MDLKATKGKFSGSTLVSVKIFTFLCFNRSTKESKNINSYQFAKK